MRTNPVEELILGRGVGFQLQKLTSIGHCRLDSILGSNSIPVIDFSPITRPKLPPLLWAGIGGLSPCLKGVAAVRNELEKKAVGGTLLLRVYRPVTHHTKIS